MKAELEELLAQALHKLQGSLPQRAGRARGDRRRAHPRRAARRLQLQRRDAPGQAEPAASRASWPRPSSRRSRPARCWRAPKWRAPDSSICTWCAARTPRYCGRCSSRASATAPATSGGGSQRLRGIRVRQSDRSAARRPRPPGRLRGDARQPAARHRPRRAARVLHQRCRPPGRHPHRQRLGALPAGARRSRCRSRTTAIAPTT